jgi:hypothetical protein
MPSLGATGGTVKDVSGNSNDVTLFDDAHFETTSRGHAIDFDRNGDYAVSAENTSFVIGTGAFTILQWVYVRSLAGVSYGMWDTLELGGSASRNNDFVLYWSGSQIGYNKVGVYSSGATRVQSDNALTLNEWHLIGLRRKNTGANGTDVITNLTKNTSYTLATNITSTANVFGRVSEQNVFHLDGQIASFQMWDRALSDSEIKQLYVDSLAPFRKKQQVAFNAYPLTLLQKIRSAVKPTTPVSVRVKHNEEPSYKAGYAKSASESANPKLWDGLVSAFVPSFGVTGETLHDLTASNNDGIIYHQNRTINEVWTKTKVGPAVSTYPSGGFQGITTPANNLSMDEFTIVANVRFENRYPGTYPCITVKENNYLDRNWFLGMFPDEEIAFVRSMSGDRWVKSGVVPNKTDFYSIAATSSKVLSHAIYVNGELKNSAHYTGTRSVAGNQNYIGIYKGNINYPLGGSISCILYYSRILSPSEIKHLYADPLAPFRRKAKPIGYQPNKELRGLFRT